MRKSNLQLLQEAIAAGNMEKAAELTAKLQKTADSKTKKSTKQKTSPASRKRKTVDKEVKAAAVMDESEYIASTKPTFTQKKLPRRVSMDEIPFVNTFNPTEYGTLPAKLKKAEKQIKRKVNIVPRPGQENATRNPVKKVTKTCAICGDKIQVYPWEAETVDGQSSFRCHKSACVKAR